MVAQLAGWMLLEGMGDWQFAGGLEAVGNVGWGVREV